VRRLSRRPHGTVETGGILVIPVEAMMSGNDNHHKDCGKRISETRTRKIPVRSCWKIKQEKAKMKYYLRFSSEELE